MHVPLPMTAPRAEAAVTIPDAARSVQAAADLKNLQQLVYLRWTAVFGQVVTIEAAHFALGLALPYREMLVVIGGLVLFNALSMLRLKLRPALQVHAPELFVALLVDVGVLTVQLYLSGGIGNPFVFLYLLQVTLGAVLLRGAYIWSMVILTTLCVAGLTQYHLPLPLVHDLRDGFSSLYAFGLIVCFVLNATLVSYFITRIQHNLRERDARLAAARRRRAEEDHIVRMGLLASGAAHELGTPLSTVAVILGDWARDPRLAGDTALRDDIAEMQAQMLRCKSIVSGILLSAGEARSEASALTTARAFVDTLVQEWRETRSIDQFLCENALTQDIPMVSDTTFKQMVFNVLDNAREASPGWVWLSAAQHDGHLSLVVSDRGPGFAPQILARLGSPYQSTKQRPGAGLGLFLVFNVARTLGGNVSARNLPGGGAEVTIRLPLSSIALQGPPAHDHGH